MWFAMEKWIFSLVTEAIIQFFYVSLQSDYYGVRLLPLAHDRTFVMTDGHGRRKVEYMDGMWKTRVTMVQYDIVWRMVAENRNRIESLVAALPACDVIVLPEMFTTGFVAEPHGVAEKADDSETVRWMARMAQYCDCAVAGSIVVRTDEGFRNRLYFVTPDGVSYYDKHHLFGYGGEDRHFVAGQQRLVVEWRGVRWMPVICYDLRFPTWCRNREDYDVMICVASWPQGRIQVWRTLLAARAIENQCFIVGVNRVGDDPTGHYSGGSMVADPWGRCVAECKDECQEAVTYGLNISGMRTFREKFPVLRDRDGMLTS